MAIPVAQTQGIRISVRSQYREDASSPGENKYFFVYEITIENEGEQPVQLLSRHWIIKDAFNCVEEVRGEGVIGQQPIIVPGESFVYQSGCPLQTEYGTMRGTYLMERPNGEQFEAAIPPFPLVVSYLLN